jgi:MFS family permease
LLARYFKLRSLIVIGFILTGATTCLLPLVHNLPLLLASQFLAGVGIGLQLTLLMSLCTQTIDPGRKASAMGFFQAVYGIGMVIGPVLIGLLADNFGLGTGFVIIGMISLMTSVLAAFVLKPNLEMI